MKSKESIGLKIFLQLQLFELRGKNNQIQMETINLILIVGES